MSKTGQLTFAPLSPENWDQFVELFGKKGACGGCWCMYFRMGKQEFREGTKNGVNKERMEKVVSDKKASGIMAFMDDKAVAWAAFAPRADFSRFERSRVHKPIDDMRVWSIPCLFVDRKYRKQGVSVALLAGVIEYARANGIDVLEAYPVVPTAGKLPDTFAYYGLYTAFEKAGFSIVDQTSKNRPMVRYYVK
jgi:GNAT superfamily N-acetyltransferase